MTRLLVLGALGMAIALASTPGEAQNRRVKDYFHLLEQDQNGDGSLTRRDFVSEPENAEFTRGCIERIRADATFGDLPQEDRRRLNRLYRIAGGGPGRVRADADQARDEFIRQHPNLELEDDGC